MTEESEFGKGLIVCLVKFAEHFMKLQSDIETYKKYNIGGINNHPESSAVGLWANGATDHLYDIEVPEGKDWDEIREKVEELKTKGLEMGHGLNSLSNKSTKEDAEYLMDLTKEIAILIDKKLGLEPDLGSC